MRYLIDFSYSGELFNGYQKQNGLRTVQGEIEKVLTSFNNGYDVTIYSSGRTDAKVNATHQIAHFDLNVNITPYKLKYALNSYLPDDIYINDIKEVSDSFHARYNVKSKIYEYKINMGTYDPIKRNYIYQYGKKLKVDKIKEALNYFVGTHDFTTFTCAEDKRENKVRTILQVNIKQEDDILTISFEGTGFLKYQIRNMVGLLIKIGEDKLNVQEIPYLFEKKDRRKIGLTAPACGLTLVKVNY